MQFFNETSNYPGDSVPLQPRFGTLLLLAFPKTKSTFERKEISSHQWDSGKYNREADGNWENCVRSQGAYFEGHWGVIVLYTMFLVSLINVSIFHSTRLDTSWTDPVFFLGFTEIWCHHIPDKQERRDTVLYGTPSLHLAWSALALCCCSTPLDRPTGAFPQGERAWECYHKKPLSLLTSSLESCLTSLLLSPTSSAHPFSPVWEDKSQLSERTQGQTTLTRRSNYIFLSFLNYILSIMLL